MSRHDNPDLSNLLSKMNMFNLDPYQNREMASQWFGDAADENEDDNNSWTAGPKPEMDLNNAHFVPDASILSNCKDGESCKLEMPADTSSDATALDTETTSQHILPLIGRVHYANDKAGWIQSSIVIIYWLYGVWSVNVVIMYPQYQDGKLPVGIFFFYNTIGILCITSFFKAMLTSPGRVYKSGQDMVDQEKSEWTFCKVCRFYRPPRAHHCSRCKHCVPRMDHHCPWINNCVGEENHYAFYVLVLYAFALSVASLTLQVIYYLKFKDCKNCDQESWVIYYQTTWVTIGTVLSVLMSMASGSLVAIQHLGFVTNMTTIDWMKLQRNVHMYGMQNYKLPYPAKSCFTAYQDVFGRGFCCWWFLPCRKRRATPFHLRSGENI